MLLLRLALLFTLFAYVLAQPACTISIFCNDTLLRPVQLSGIFNDSKTFVDMPLLVDPDVVMQQLALLGDNPSTEELTEFVNAYFGEAGSDLLSWTPTDWVENPPFLEGICLSYSDINS